MMSVRFKKQGGKACEGQAIGIMGSDVLISYQIENGEPRKRWLPRKRVLEVEGGDERLATLPRYRRVTCKTHDATYYTNCTTCGTTGATSIMPVTKESN